MSSPFKNLKGMVYVDTVVDVPFTPNGEKENPELVLHVNTFAPGFINEIGRQTVANLQKRGVEGFPGSLAYTLENSRLLFDRLGEYVVGWTHTPEDKDEKPTPFTKENLSALLSESFSDWQKLFVINNYHKARSEVAEKKAEEQESGNAQSGGAS